MYIQCLQSFRSSRAILLHCHCESGCLAILCFVLRAQAISIPIPNVARQLARLSLSSSRTWVSLSACQQVEREQEGDEAVGQMFTCRWLAFAFVTHLFWFVYHCDLYFFAFFLLSPTTPFTPPLSRLQPVFTQLYPTSLALSIWKIVKSARRAIKLSSDLLTHFSLNLADATLSIPAVPILSSRTSAHPSAVGLLLCNN